MRSTSKIVILVAGMLTSGCLPMAQQYQASAPAVTEKPENSGPQSPATPPAPLLCKNQNMGLAARFRMYIQDSAVTAIPAATAENGNSLMIGYFGQITDTYKRELRSYVQARYITAHENKNLLIEKTITPFHATSQDRRLLALKGFDSSYVAVTGPSAGNFSGYNPPVRLFKFNLAQNEFQLLAQVNLPNVFVREAQLDIQGQQGILTLLSLNNNMTLIHFFKIDLVTGAASEIPSLATSYPSHRIYLKTFKLHAAGFILGLHQEVFVPTSGGGGYFVNQHHVLRSTDGFSFQHEEPFQAASFRDVAMSIDMHDNVYRVSNAHKHVQDRQGYPFIDSAIVAERYDGSSVVPVEIKFTPFRFAYGGFAAQNLLTENNDLYILARTYKSSNAPTADYLLLKTHDGGLTVHEQAVTKDNSSALLYYMARTQGSTFIVGNDQNSLETLVFCGK